MENVLKFEDAIVKWLIAEVVSYGVPEKWYNYRYLVNILGRTRIHKILFNTFEEQNIPITRSWYRYGGFIHCSSLEKNKYNRLLKNCINNDKRLMYYRKQIKDYDIDSEEIINNLIENVNNILNKKLTSYIPEFYNTAPEKYRNIYLCKNNLYVSLHRFDKISNIDTIMNNIDEVFDYITNYHKYIFNLGYDNISDITLMFTNNIEKVFYKIGYQKLSKKKLLKKQLNFIRMMDFYFDKYIWLPCATYVSSQTVTGYRSSTEKLKRISQNEEEHNGNIITSYQFLNELSNNIDENSLGITWNEVYNMYESKYKNNKFDKFISKLQKINQHEAIKI